MKALSIAILLLGLVVAILADTDANTQINFNFAGMIPAAGASNPGSSATWKTGYGGVAIPFGWGDITTFATLKDGSVDAVGIEVSTSLLEVFPTRFTDPLLPYGAVLDLPFEARKSVFRSVQVGYNPQGHPPAGVWTFPHFDFHFFTLSSAEINSIAPGFCANYSGDGIDAFTTCEVAPRVVLPVDPKYIPADFHWENTPVAYMGDHSASSNDAAFVTPGSFTHSWIYTRTDGYVIGYEPMITVAYLLSRTVDECHDIPAQPNVQFSGYYPTTWCIRLNPAAASFQITVEGFVLRHSS